MRISCYAQVSGRVQGVGFRYFVLREATQRGIGGWVRNCEDGSVQMLLHSFGQCRYTNRLRIMV